jgi:hypothetical protein
LTKHLEISRLLSTWVITLAMVTVIGLLEHQEVSAINGANGTSSNGTAGLNGANGTSGPHVHGANTNAGALPKSGMFFD